VDTIKEVEAGRVRGADVLQARRRLSQTGV